MSRNVMGCFATAAELQNLAAALRSLAARDSPGLCVYVGEDASLGSAREAARDLGLAIDFEPGGLAPAAPAPQLSQLSRAAERLAALLSREAPDLLLVVGASPGAAGAALAASASGLPLGHLSSGEANFPEARDLQRLISRLASLHFSSDAAWLAEVTAEGAPPGRTLHTREDADRAGPQVADAILRFFADPAQPIDGKGAALEDFVKRALTGIREISPEAALQLLETPGREGWHFLDVREAEEYAEGHLPGARNAPRGFLEVRADLSHYKRDPWFEDRARKLVLYCGGGHRSALATRTLSEMGFGQVRSLAEGYTGWIERGYPLEEGSG